MKRALAIAVALCTLGVVGFSQIAFTGKWTAMLCATNLQTPSFTLTSTLTLNYEVVPGITVSSVSGFGTTGFTSQKFTMKGAFGPFSITGNMWFNPATPAYTAADLTTGFDFTGLAVGLTVRHWTPNNGRWLSDWWPDESPCTDDVADDGYLQYIFTTTLSPVTIKARFADCCTGAAFQDVKISLKGIGLCCGITYDASLSFTKAGFQYVTFTVKNFAAICCGISFDLSVKFTVDAKTVSVTPKFAGFGEACFTVYADLDSEGGEGEDLYLNGIRVDGFSIKCTLGDCNYIEFVTFLSPQHADLYFDPIPFDTVCGEFEYINLGFCGVGCCGGQWTADLAVYFGTKGGLFDVTRLVYSVSIPIMSNLTVDLSGTVPAASCATPKYCIGWTFTF